jgi:hypothetical protein
MWVPNGDSDQFCSNCGAALTSDVVAAGAPAAAPEQAAEMAESDFMGDSDEPDEVVTEGEMQEEAIAALPAPVPEAGAMPEPEFRAGPPAPPPPKPAYQPPSAGARPGLPTSGMAIASLLLGVAGLTFVPLLASILAILFGYMARKEIRQRPGELAGDGLALAGIVMGWIAVGLSVLGLLFAGAVSVCGLCGAFGAGGWQ